MIRVSHGSTQLAVIGMSAGEDPQLVPVLLFVQADGTHITLVSFAIVLGRNLFQLFFGQPIPPALFLEMDPKNYRYGSRAQNEHCQNPIGKDAGIGQKESIVKDQKHLSPLLVDEEGTQVLRALLADEHRRDPDLLLDFGTPHHAQQFIGIHIVYHGCTIPGLLSM